MSALYYASMSNDIRPKLIKREIESVELNERTVPRSEGIWSFLHKWKLDYIVEIAEKGEITDFPYYDGCILFKCYPKKFPWIKDYSGNNADILTT
jgi:hypothetical protein